MKDAISNKPIGVCCKKDDWTQFVAAIDGEGFEHLELSFSGSDPDSQLFDSVLLGQIRAMSARCGLPLSVHAPGGINLAEKVTRLRSVSVQVVKEAVIAADQLGARWVTVHLGAAGFPNSDVQQKYARLELAVDSLQQVLRATAESRVLLALENLPRNPASTSVCRLGDCGDELAYVLRALDSPRVGVVLDVGHARMFAGDDALQALLAKVAPRVLGFHLHWNDRSVDAHAVLPRRSDELDHHLRTIDRMVSAQTPVLLENHTLAENRDSARVLIDASSGEHDPACRRAS